MKRMVTGGILFMALAFAPVSWNGCDAKTNPAQSANEDGAEKLLALAKSYKSTGHSSEALNCYRQAAEHGQPQAQAWLGAAYYDGLPGVPRDRAVAAKWLRKAAEHGCAKEVYCLLGCLYEKGEGVPQNFPEAVDWYRKAAEQGDAEAQIRMGIVLMHGAAGVSQDVAEAYKWFSLAAAHGSKELNRYRVELLRLMTSEQIAAGQARATTFVRK